MTNQDRPGPRRGSARWTTTLVGVASLLAVLTAANAGPVAGAAAQIVDVQIAADADDAEEAGLTVDLGSSDLELAVDGGDDQTVGLRFRGVGVQQAAGLTEAYIQFTVDETSSADTELTIRAELVDDAAPFTTAAGDVSSRSTTATWITWSPDPWSNVGEAGAAQRTPDLRPIIQPVIDQAGWTVGNSIVVIITGDGSGKRVAESHDGRASAAPTLHLEYATTPGNDAPAVDAGEDRRLVLPESELCLAADATDDGIPGPLAVNWSQVSGPAVPLVPHGADMVSAAFTGSGVHHFRALADDGELSATDDVSVTVGRRIDVPGDAATIQGGVDMAVDGDIVVVGPGTWFENVDIDDKTITLASHYLFSGDPADRAATIIDGSGAQYTVRFGFDVGPESTIVGFHVRNGIDGVLINSHINVFDNRVTGTHDGLEYKNYSGGVARGNILENNEDDGIDVNRRTALLAEGNLIRYNDGDGVEMRMNDYTEPLLLETTYRNNVIYGNDSDGIQLIDYEGYSARRVIIEGNVLADNAQAGIGIMGGGVTSENFEGASALEEIIVTNNVIVGNDHGLTGGDDLTARNNVFADNTNIAVKNVDGGSSMSHTLFWNNGTDVVNSNVDGPSTVVGDPLLDAAWQPLAGSPAIDAGVDVGIPFAGAAPDLGAYETPINAEPVVHAGADVAVAWTPGPVPLAGSAADDDRPGGAGTLVASWSQRSGPCGVVLGDATSPTTSATFPGPGTYRFRLGADDGWARSFDDVTVTVTEALPVVVPGAIGVAEGDTGSTIVEVPLTLSSPSSSPVSVEWTTFDLLTNPMVAVSGSDHLAASGTATFAPGETQASVAITVLGDTVDEPPLLWGEWGFVAFSNPTNATLDLSFFGLGIFVILDDDPG